jgi:hypothetical protein
MSSATPATTPSHKPRWPKVKSVLLKVTLIDWFRSFPNTIRHIIASTILTVVVMVLSGVFTKLLVIGFVDFDIVNENSSVNGAYTVTHYFFQKFPDLHPASC